MNRVRLAKIFYIFCSTLLGLSGIMIMLLLRTNVETCCTVLAIVLILTGCCKIFSYFSKDLYFLVFQFDLALGILLCITGLAMLLHSDYIVSFLPFIAGAVVLTDGGFKIQTAVDAKRFGLKQWNIMALIAVFCSAAGLILMLFFTGLDLKASILAGIALLADCILNFLAVISAVKAPVKGKH